MILLIFIFKGLKYCIFLQVKTTQKKLSFLNSSSNKENVNNSKENATKINNSEQMGSWKSETTLI